MNPSFNDIFHICTLVHKLTKLDIEFLSDNKGFSFQLLCAHQISSILKPYRDKSLVFIHNCLQQKQQKENIKQFYCYTDSLKLSYLAIGLENNISYIGTIIVGPFLLDIPNDNLISNIIYNNGLPLGFKYQIQQYYKSLSILDHNNCKALGQVIINLLLNSVIDTKIAYLENDNIESIQEDALSNMHESMNEIEIRYKIEKALLNAVEKGDVEQALKNLNFLVFEPTHRVPGNPLRAYKNILFSFNTMLRLAAERAGVSPVYLHNLSDKFAILIEKISTFAELNNMGNKLIHEYCDLVQNKSTVGYSPIVKKAIDYINFNFKKPISLKSISENIGINPCHLSRQFKKETGMTITEFIQRRRIKEAQFLIEQNSKSITDIALAVGFENHNYFCKVFKKLTSMTPTEYLKNRNADKNVNSKTR